MKKYQVFVRFFIKNFYFFATFRIAVCRKMGYNETIITKGGLSAFSAGFAAVFPSFFTAHIVVPIKSAIIHLSPL
jgi:hypothetical protein